MLIGGGCICEFSVHTGLCPGWKYREVQRPTFEGARGIGQRVVSAEMAQIATQGGVASPGGVGLSGSCWSVGSRCGGGFTQPQGGGRKSNHRLASI